LPPDRMLSFLWSWQLQVFRLLVEKLDPADAE
jgi:hypothetical protein